MNQTLESYYQQAYSSTMIIADKREINRGFLRHDALLSIIIKHLHVNV